MKPSTPSPPRGSRSPRSPESAAGALPPLCLPATARPAESTEPPAVRPGVATFHGVSDPALAGGVHGQYATVARAAGAGLWPLRPDRLAFPHPAAACE